MGLLIERKGRRRGREGGRQGWEMVCMMTNLPARERRPIHACFERPTTLKSQKRLEKREQQNQDCESQKRERARMKYEKKKHRSSKKP